MMAQTTISVRIDSDLKKNFDAVCNDLGLSMTTAITILAKKMSREKRIPFEVAIDPFYSADEAWEDFEYWLKQDKKTLKRILLFLKDIERNGYEGIGKPEPLLGDLSAYWSRRIDAANRIVYRIDGDTIKIVQCGSHYRDK